MDVNFNLSLFEKGIDSVLLLPHKFSSLLEAIGLALDVDNGAMVENAVENRGGDFPALFNRFFLHFITGADIPTLFPLFFQRPSAP